MQHMDTVVTDVLIATVLISFIVWFYYMRSMYLCIKAVRPELRKASPWWAAALWLPFVGGFIQLFIVWVISRGFDEEARGRAMAPPAKEFALIGYVAGVVSIPMLFLRGAPALALTVLYMGAWTLWWVRAVRFRKSLAGTGRVNTDSGNKG